MNPKSTYFSVSEYAVLLGITRDAVLKRIKKGEIKAAKVGRNFAVFADADKYVSIAQYARIVGISRIAVYNRIKKGQLKALKVGRNHLIRADEASDVKKNRKQRQSAIEYQQNLPADKSTSPEKAHFSVPQLARYLGITRDAVYKKIKRGEVQASQVGRNFATFIREKEFVSVAQLAALLGISRIAVYKRIKKGQIQAERVGHNHLIAVEYLKKYLNESQCVALKRLIGEKKKI